MFKARPEDIRFSKKAAPLEHHSSRGKIVRNSGSFTRGSQLFTHEASMTWAGIRLPLILWLATSGALGSTIMSFYFREHELQLVLMKIYAELWHWVSLNPQKDVHLTLPDDSVVVGLMRRVPYHPAVVFAWSKFMHLLAASALGAVFICAPLTIWFVDYSRKRGSDILKERHERGSLLIGRRELDAQIRAFNLAAFRQECATREPPASAQAVLKLPLPERVARGFHAPYRVATLPCPWRLEQSHMMLIGTTGAGKTTELKKIVMQARLRGHRCVIFDLTGSFIESFYNPATDVILNTMDTRCQPWTIFNDCDNYSDLLSAATALIPSGKNAEDDFWQKAARTLFTEMCVKLIARKATSNGALAYHLMQADLKRISEELENTVAAPLVATQAAKMAESIRATFNTHANAVRFLPDPAPGTPGFSINTWMANTGNDGSILFISSNHNDLVLNRPLLTLWMDLAVNALFRMGPTRDLRTWFLLDEVHALHRLPAIVHGLQTARAVGGAFVLGLHSFAMLSETYGENGAIGLTSLAGTKLILKTPDIETARRCSDFIGSREVRQMDEAYSYGYNSTRDASTITPRKEVQHLVMPDDIKDLPALHGFVKFPDGFPATRIELAYRTYPAVAKGFERVTHMRASAYTPAEDVDGGRTGGEGRETDGPANEAPLVADPGNDGRTTPGGPEQAKSEPATEAERLGQESSGKTAPPKTSPSGTGRGDGTKPETPGIASSGFDSRLKASDEGAVKGEPSRPGPPDGSTGARRTESGDKRDDAKAPDACSDARAGNQESEIAREQRLGIGTNEEKDDPDRGDEGGMEL